MISRFLIIAVLFSLVLIAHLLEKVVGTRREVLVTRKVPKTAHIFHRNLGFISRVLRELLGSSTRLSLKLEQARHSSSRPTKQPDMPI